MVNPFALIKHLWRETLLFIHFRSPYIQGVPLEHAKLFDSIEDADYAWQRFQRTMDTGHYRNGLREVPVGGKVKYAVKVCSSCGYLGLPQYSHNADRVVAGDY